MIQRLYIALFLLPSLIYSQKDWNVSLGTDLNMCNNAVYSGFVAWGSHLGLHYNMLELDLAINTVNKLPFSKPQRIGIQWPNITFKYHFGSKHVSHFVAFANFQHNKFIFDPGIASPVYYNVKDENCYNCLLRTKSTNFHLGFSYELIAWHHLTFPISIGGGLGYLTSKEMNTSEPYYDTYISIWPPYNKWVFSPFISIGLKYYFLKYQNLEIDKRQPYK